MSPVEKLEAAIAKLELQKSESVDNSVEPRWRVRPLGLRESDILSEYGDEFEDDSEVIAEHVYRPDAELIVTMRRMLGPQLNYLRDQHYRMVRDVGGGTPEIHYRHALAIADSILGDAS